MSLYDDWLVEKGHVKRVVRADLPERAKGQACRNCRFMVRHFFSDKYNYCRLKRSNHTPNGLGKTKRMDWCARWDSEGEAEPKTA